MLARLTNALGTGFSLPFLTIYLIEVKHIPAVFSGGALGGANLAGIAFTPAAGQIIARVGAKPVTIAAPLLSAALYLGLPLTSGTWSMAIVTATGIPVALLRPAQQTLIAQASTPARRHRVFAWAQAGVNVGLGLGGAAGTLLIASSSSGFLSVIMINACSYVITSACFAMVPRTGARADLPDRQTSYRHVLATPGMRPVLLLHFAYFMVVASTFTVAIPLYIIVTLHGARAVSGIVFASNSVAVVALQGPILRRIEGRSRIDALTLSMAVSGTAWIITALTAAVAGKLVMMTGLLIVAGIMIAFGECLYNPVMEPLVADLAEATDTGHAFAALTMARQAGSVIGPVVAGILMTSLGAAAWLLFSLCCAGSLLLVDQIRPNLHAGQISVPSGNNARK